LADFSAQAKVGLVVILAFIMVFSGLRMLERGVKGNTIDIFVTFEEARGLSKGVDVRIAGVVKGSITGVSYNPERDLAIVAVRMKKDAVFPKDSLFVASTEGLVGEKVINISVPEKSKKGMVEDGDEFMGKFEDGFDQLVLKGNETLDEVNEILDKVSEKMDTDFINEIIADLTKSIKETLENVNTILTSLDSVVASNADEINETLNNLVAMSANFEDVSSDIKEMVSDPEIERQIDAIASGLEASIATLQRITADIEEITDDPEIKQGIRDSVKLTGEVLEDTKETIGEIKETLSGVNTKIDEISELTDIEVSGRISGRYVSNKDPEPGEDEDLALADVELKMETNKGFIQVGVDGVGEESEFSLQGGKYINPDLAMRAGIIRGKVGVGFDYAMGNATWTLDGYDPNDPKINSFLGFKLGDDYSLRIGVEDAFGETNMMAGIAIEF